MRVLWYVSQMTQSGGGERFTLATSNAIENAGHEILVVSDVVSDAAFFSGTYNRDNVVDLGGSYDEKISFIRTGVKKLLALRQLYKVILGFKPDLILCQSEFDAVRICLVRKFFPKIPFRVFIFGQMFQFPQYITKFSAIFKKHCKTIMDSSPGYDADFSYKRRLRNPAVWFLNEVISICQFYSVRSAEEVYVLSNQVKWEVSLLYGTDAKVLRGGVDESQIDKDSVISPRKINNPARIVSICRLEPKKRVDLLIRGFDLSQCEGQLIIVGDGPERQYLEKLAGRSSKKDNIQFLGRLPDDERVAELRAADCFCYLDVGDFGITVVEAMAAGISIVVTEDFDLRALGKNVPSVISIKATEENLSNTLSNLASIGRSSSLNLEILTRLTWQHVAAELTEKM